MSTKNTWLCCENVPDVPPRDFDEVQRDRDKYLRSFFNIEQWLYLEWLEVKRGHIQRVNAKG